MKKTVKIGWAPTKRNTFNHEQWMKTRDEIRKVVDGWNMNGAIELVDIDDVTDEAILQTEKEAIKVADKFIREKVDGIFVPHCNFGHESAVADLCRAVGVPVLVWGPRDDDPEKNATDIGVGRTRDSQCGMFATGKALRRMNVPFTYIPNTDIKDMAFERGYKAFAAVCAVVRDFKTTRVLQIGTRPEPFWTVMINEGELVEKFNIHVLPVPLPELGGLADKYRTENGDIQKKALKMIADNSKNIDLTEDELQRLAAFYCATVELNDKYDTNCAAIHCWGGFRDTMGVAACGINGFLADFADISVGCETDIHGVISSRVMEAASLYRSKILFADLTIRHPYNDNAELMWHCGNYPPSTSGGGCEFGRGGRTHFEGKIDQPMTICRFDGDHGEYSMLISEGKTVSGPSTGGTYSWFETKDWVALEDKVVKGPYVHHSACAYGHYAPILTEACNYLGVKADLLDAEEEKAMRHFWYGR